MGSSDQKCVAMCMDRFEEQMILKMNKIYLSSSLQVHGLLQPGVEGLHKAVTARNVKGRQRTSQPEAIWVNLVRCKSYESALLH